MTAEDTFRAGVDACKPYAGDNITITLRLGLARELVSTLDALRKSYDERGQAIAAIRPTCETCESRYVPPTGGEPCCGLTRMTDGIHPTVTIVPCSFLGNGCYAHAPKAAQ